MNMNNGTLAFTGKHTGNWHNTTMDVISLSGKALKPSLSVNGGIKFLERMFVKDCGNCIRAHTLTWVTMVLCIIPLVYE